MNFKDFFCILIKAYADCFDTECDMDGEDSTVLVDEFYNTDCDVTDDDKEVIEELDQVSISLTSIVLAFSKINNKQNLSLVEHYVNVRRRVGVSSCPFL